MYYVLNLKLYDVDDIKIEIPEESQRKIYDFVKTTLEIDTTDIPIERAHIISKRVWYSTDDHAIDLL